MPPRRELLLQIARLAGGDAFERQFGVPQTADPPNEALAAFIDQHVEFIAVGLVAEAAASDDVTNQGAATVYLDDRLDALAPVITLAQAGRIREQFQQQTSGW